ncbi:MAG TPA: hypothetical protein PLV92_17545 [Pirellulaceae bacterium]|nr:hypothetical protein [Pirellulaceae bacterium]
MSRVPSRRRFLVDVGRGTLMAALGSALAVDLDLVPAAFAKDLDGRLSFGDLEPLVSTLQETPVGRLQPLLIEKLRGGMPLKTLVAAGALANARTFGGEDYIGFHTFMALSPALSMSSLMPSGAEALPVLKVLYRNSNRIQEFGGKDAEVLHSVAVGPAVSAEKGETLPDAIRSRDVRHAEQMLAGLVSTDRRAALDALIPAVHDMHPEVHRTVLPYRAWEMQEIVGTQHALTLLRQSLRYCVKAEPQRRPETTAHGAMLVGLLDEFKLHGKTPGTKPAEDAFVEQLSRTFATASAEDAGRAAASALAEGFDPAAIGEAISLAASQLVLRDGGRLPQWEDRLKPAGSVHGDSVGVHASDAANAWRNLSRVGSGRNIFACLIIGAWQVARDRNYPGNLLSEPLPAKHHLDRLTPKDADGLLAKLDEAVQNNLQGQATAIAHRYGELSLPAERLFRSLLRYAVSEDGALHAEKYFQTVWDDFHTTRPTARWRHLVALARVTASEYGKPAAGQAEARDLLGLKS